MKHRGRKEEKECQRVLEGAEHVCKGINHKSISHYDIVKVTGEYK